MLSSLTEKVFHIFWFFYWLPPFNFFLCVGLLSQLHLYLLTRPVKRKQMFKMVFVLPLRRSCQVNLPTQKQNVLILLFKRRRAAVLFFHFWLKITI